MASSLSEVVGAHRTPTPTPTDVKSAAVGVADEAEPGAVHANALPSTPKRARDELTDASTVHNQKKASIVLDADDSNEDYEDIPPYFKAHYKASDALGTFIRAHKLDASIFCSDEWHGLLEAINEGPLPPSTALETTPALLLMRASREQCQLAICRRRTERAQSSSCDPDR